MGEIWIDDSNLKPDRDNVLELPLRPTVELRMPYERWRAVCRREGIDCQNIKPGKDLIITLRCIRMR